MATNLQQYQLPQISRRLNTTEKREISNKIGQKINVHIPPPQFPLNEMHKYFVEGGKVSRVCLHPKSEIERFRIH